MPTFQEQMPYTDGEKRYHTLSFALRRRFGAPVWKAAVDAGFTCPNRDGSKGREGCAFCLGGNGDFTAGSHLSPVEQISAEQRRIRQRRPDAQVIAYFQAYTNTYAPAERLRMIYDPVVGLEGVCGISIATRPDCLPAEVLNYLEELAARTYLTVELGLQTIHDATAERIRRGYGLEAFLEAVHRLHERRIRVCVHLINGLPGEEPEDMLETARLIGGLRPGGVKIHALQILKDTPMADWWRRGEVNALTKEAYTDIVCRQLEWLPPETVIERLTGDGRKELLLAPDWRCGKIAVLAGIDRRLREGDRWQGKRFCMDSPT